MTKAAILIDGGYFLKRLPVVRRDVDSTSAEAAAGAVEQLIRGHLNQLNDIQKASNPLSLLYRSFYYDARPYDKKAHTPITNRPIDYARSPQALFRKGFFDALRGRPNLAVRLGEVRKDIDRSWILKAQPQTNLLNGRLTANELTDADFVPAAKLARREGVQFILDPLWQNVSPDLFEHIDGLRSGFPRPRPHGQTVVAEDR